MDWKNQLTKTPYLVLFIVLISIGVGTAAALITITLAGDVVIEGDLDMTNGKISNLVTPSESADAATKAYVDSLTITDALDLLGCSTDQIARFDGNNWICGKFTAKNNPITIVDDTDGVGQDTSIAIGTDGNPVISYHDETNGDLKVAHCGNTLCSTGNTITTVDSTDLVGRYTSIAIGTDGNPVISYNIMLDESSGDLKVAHCGNALCSAGNTITTVDSTDFVGFHTSIAIGTDGNPVISYYDVTNKALKVAHCGNALCSTGNTITTVDDTDNVGRYTSIAIGTDGNPVISYHDNTNGDLKMVHCGDMDCAENVNNNTITTVDISIDDVGEFTSIAIGTDGNPVISYYDSTNEDLKVAHCNNALCSAGIAIIPFANNIDDLGTYTSIAIGTDGNPVISYYDDTNGDLELAHCGTISCSEGNTITTVDSIDGAGRHTSIAIGTDGNPVISYEGSNNDLKVAVDGTVLIFE